MRMTALLSGILLFLIPGPRLYSQTEDSWDQGYSLMLEAYRLRAAGQEEPAREKMARALALFRRTAAERTSLEVRPEVDYEIEESPLGVNLIENRALFKIEFNSGSPPPEKGPPDGEAVLRLQQMIVQSLAQVIQDNAELKASLSRMEKNSEENSQLGDRVSDISADTENIPDIAQDVEDIRDRTDDIYDQVDSLASDNETLQAVDDLATELSDINSALDLLRDILDIVQDIKDDTGDIGNLESGISDVQSSVESSGE